MKKVIIILNYNDFDTTATLLNLIKGYNVFDRCIVVDNCSSDGSYESLCNLKYDNIDVLKSDKNSGYACGNNLGASYAIKNYHPDVMFFSNPDVAFEELTATGILDLLTQNPQYAVSAPLVTSGYNVWRQPSYWGVIESLFLILYNLDKAVIKQRLLMKKGLYEVGVVEGSFFAIKTDAFSAIGGFDERTFLYYEENILGFKLKKNNYKTIVDSSLFYDHLHSKSIQKEYKSKANAFGNFHAGMKIYIEEYLNCGKIRVVIFELLYMLAFCERKIYDVYKRLRQK